MKEIVPHKYKDDKLFFDDLTAKVEFNEHFANIGKTLEKTQMLNQGADWALDHDKEHTNRNDYFRPQSVDVNSHTCCKTIIIKQHKFCWLRRNPTQICK